LNTFTKLSPSLYLRFIKEKPFLFIVSTFLALWPFLLETLGFLSFIPLLQADENGIVTIDLPYIEKFQLNISTMLICLAALFTLQWFSNTAKVYVSYLWANKITESYKQKLFIHLQNKSCLETMNQNKGHWIQLFQNEFRHLSYALVSTIYLNAAIIFTIITLLLLFYLSPELSSILFPLGLLVFLSILISNKLIQKYAISHQQHQQEEAAFLLENWQHPIILTLHQAKSWMKSKYFIILSKTQKASFLHLILTWSAPHWTRWVIFMCIISFLIVHSFLSPQSKMSAQSLITYLIILSRLQPITYTLSHDLANLVTGEVAWKAISKKFSNESIIHEPIKEISFKNLIQIKNVSFTYPNRTEQLGPYHLEIPIKSIYGIYGSSGSGKSTLMHLIMGLHQPTHGQIFIDQENYSDINKQALWSKMAYVPQEPDFFQMTLKDNLCLGQIKNDSEIHSYLKTWGLTKLVASLPNGLSHMIYPNGKDLSGGQKKKLMMVRALLRKPEILFLDEPCNGLDETSKKEWIQSLELLPKNITTIIITHDTTLLNICDNVFKVS